MAELDWEHLVGLGHHRMAGSCGMWGQPHVYHGHLTVDNDFTFPVSSGQIERHELGSNKARKESGALKIDTCPREWP